jgi:ATP-dependent Zn protease
MMVWGHDVVDIFINWFPMLLLIGVWIVFLRRMQGGGRYMTQYQRDYMATAQRQTEILERIALALEKRST